MSKLLTNNVIYSFVFHFQSVLSYFQIFHPIWDHKIGFLFINSVQDGIGVPSSLFLVTCWTHEDTNMFTIIVNDHVDCNTVWCSFMLYIYIV